tara:strand:+ start:36 stop:707 length:672 start_codon:yes stop_codon:yes gene_type:complete
MQTKLTYEWMIEQVDKLEKAVINQCDFCRGKGNKKIFPSGKKFDEYIETNKKIAQFDEKRINNIKLIEKFINHYEFLVLEEIMIERKNNGNYKRWENILERLERSRKIINKLTTTLQYSIDIKSDTNIDIISKVSLIFLPLSFITGYFGMNFTSMGMLGKNVNYKGILMWKNGHTFVKILLLFVLVASIIILLIVDRYNRKNNELHQTLVGLVERQGIASDDL